MRNAEYEIRDTKYEIRNTKRGTWNVERGTQNTDPSKTIKYKKIIVFYMTIIKTCVTFTLVILVFTSSNAIIAINVIYIETDNSLLALTGNITLSKYAAKPDEIILVTVLVTDNSQPVFNATVTMSTDVGGGEFEFQSGKTDNNGKFTTRYMIPVADVSTAHIIASISHENYTNNVTAVVEFTILPLPKLFVDLIAENYSLYPGKQTLLTITVKDINNTPVNNAKIEMFDVSNGTFTPLNGSTNADGKFTTIYAAPQVEGTTTTIITAIATASGFEYGEKSINITILLPLTLNVEVYPEKTDIYSKESVIVTVRVTYNNEPLQNATVKFYLPTNGTLNQTIGVTDERGEFTVRFTASDVTNISIAQFTVLVTLEGFVDTINDSAFVRINPRGVTGDGKNGDTGIPIVNIALIGLVILIVILVIIGYIAYHRYRERKYYESINEAVSLWKGKRNI